MIFVQSNEFEVSHRETALLGADPGAFLPGVNLVRIRMISKRTMMTLLKLIILPSASLGLSWTFPSGAAQAAARLLSRHLCVVIIIIVFPFKESIITSFFFPAAAIGS